MKKILLVLIIVLALSCSKDEGYQTKNTDIKLVTGAIFRQNLQDVPWHLGNPNIYVNNKFVIYPNPVSTIVNVSSQNNISDVWIIPANPEKIYQNLDFTILLNSSLFNEPLLQANSSLTINQLSTSGLSLNVGSLPRGYYKVFFKIEGQIYWDNLYIFGSQGGSEEEVNALINYWN